MAVVVYDPVFIDGLGNDISSVDLSLIEGTDTAPSQIFTKQLQLHVDKGQEDNVSYSVTSSSKGNITISDDGILTYHGTAAFNGSDTAEIGLLRDGVEVDTLSINVTGYPVSTVDLDNGMHLYFSAMFIHLMALMQLQEVTPLGIFGLSK